MTIGHKELAKLARMTREAKLAIERGQPREAIELLTTIEHMLDNPPEKWTKLNERELTLIAGRG